MKCQSMGKIRKYFKMSPGAILIQQVINVRSTSTEDLLKRVFADNSWIMFLISS